MQYILMHENEKLAIFEYTTSLLSLIVNSKNTEKLPYLELSLKSTAEALKKWIYNRGVPVTRQRLEIDLIGMKTRSSFEYMLGNLGLSLTDHYWICPYTADFKWETINLYTNSFKSEYSLDLCDDKKSIAGKTNFVPSASLKGDLKKKWIIDDKGVRRLVKGNYNNTCRQSLCEVLATEIHKRQGKFEYTPYSLIEISSEGNLITGCECPNFTTIDTEFISAIDILNSFKKLNNTSYYEAYIQYCGSNGIDIKYIREFMEYQILTDFIITNTDRHLNNFGVIRNSNTFRLIKPAPLFDSGNSMFYNMSYIPTNKNLLDINVTSFKKKEVQLLEYVTNPGLVDISMLPSEEDVYNLFQQDLIQKEETTEKLVKAYSQKIKFLLDFQNGAKLSSYNYLKKIK